MKLVRKQRGTNPLGIASPVLTASMDRRTFLRRSGIAVGGVAAASALSVPMMKKAAADAEPASPDRSKVSQVRTICTHCSVGCGVYAEVENGVWTGQEPAFDNHYYRGPHCA